MNYTHLLCFNFEQQKSKWVSLGQNHGLGRATFFFPGVSKEMVLFVYLFYFFSLWSLPTFLHSWFPSSIFKTKTRSTASLNLSLPLTLLCPSLNCKDPYYYIGSTLIIHGNLSILTSLT